MHGKMNSIYATLTMIGIAVIGGTVIFGFTNGFFTNTLVTEFDEIKKAEASFKMIFVPTTVFYDMTDRRNTINTEWEANGGTSIDKESHTYLQFVRLNGADIFAMSWWQEVDGKLVGAINDCGQSVICFNSKNETAYMIIQILDSSVQIDEENTLKNNDRILSIKDFDGVYKEPTKIIAVDVGEIGSYDGEIVQLITLFFPTEFNNKCIFAIDYATCEMNQKLLQELQKEKEL